VKRFFIFLLFLLLGSTVCSAAQTLEGKVNWVYDGDTLKVSGIGKVRLLGIDCPEREDSPRDNYYLKQYRIEPPRLRKISAAAMQYLIKIAKNQRVTLEFDREKTDAYGRTLAYVYLRDGSMLNRLLLEQGLATVFRRFDFREKADFITREKQARQQQRGLWQKSGR
jgi:micrococcal nuclease